MKLFNSGGEGKKKVFFCVAGMKAKSQFETNFPSSELLKKIPPAGKKKKEEKRFGVIFPPFWAPYIFFYNVSPIHGPTGDGHVGGDRHSHYDSPAQTRI